MTKKISIVKDFHPFPAGRHVVDGDGNGTTFREEFLLPHLRSGERVVVDLDGAPGYPSSFLEEAFGGLVRSSMSAEVIRNHLEFSASDDYKRYIDRIWEFISRAEEQKSAAPS